MSFLAMGGYGGYVWASYGITALVLGILPLWIRRRLNNTCAELASARVSEQDDVRLTVKELE